MPMSYSPAEPLYPDVEVQLSGSNGNAGAIVGAVADALKVHLRDDLGLSGPEWRNILEDFRGQAYSGSYDDLLRTCMRWVEVT